MLLFVQRLTVVVLGIASCAVFAYARQAAPTGISAPNPDALVALVLARFASGTPEEFALVFPIEEGRTLVSQAAKNNKERYPGIGRVVWSGEHRAVLVLSGHTLAGNPNSGDVTIHSRSFSGFYEATEANGTWTIARRLPLDEQNRIRSHDLDVTVSPAEGLRVTDTMQITVGGAYGFAARLNHRAKISEVRVNGKTIEYEFGGGLLWVRIPRRQAARLTLSYSIDVERDPPLANSGSFQVDAGHVRNQYFWHPYFDFDSLADRAHFTISVRVPKEYHIATSIPQTEKVKAGIRIVRGRSSQPTFALTLLYDKDWQVVSQKVGPVRFVTYVTPNFEPSRAYLEKRFLRTYNLLFAKFGEPHAEYFGVAQSRADSQSGWHYHTNDLIVAGGKGGQPSSRGPRPRAYFAHELSHGWTSPTGPAKNFLSEGWATYAEALLLADEFGPEVGIDFWELQRNDYHAAGFNGHSSILNDPNNNGVSYSKGAWVFRMLNYVMGDAAFERGMRDYMKIVPGQSAGLEEFISAMTRAAGRDLRLFLTPWVTESSIPDINTRVEGKRLFITQTGPVFTLPLVVEFDTTKGVVRRTVELRRREEELDVSDLSGITDVRIDPDHHLLIQRRRGEVLRFELRAPEAKNVEAHGSFTSKPIPAKMSDGVWMVELPLTEGRYFWYWLIDGKLQRSDDTKQPIIKVQIVRPLKEISSPYPPR